MPKKSLKMCIAPQPSAGKPSTRKSKDSVKFKGNWEETRDSLHKKINHHKDPIFEESSSDEEYQPRKSTAPQRMTVSNGLDVITSNISFQEKMHEREEKEKRNKSVFASALRKTKVWVQEAVTGEPVFSDEDWEENLARETALEKIKRKKDKEFRREMVRKSMALGIDRHETADLIHLNENKPLRLTADEVALVEAETQRLVEISREEREEEEEERRESKAIEKAHKMPNRFSLALKTVMFGTESAVNEITRHPRFDSRTSMHEIDTQGNETRETNTRRPTKFNFNAPVASESEEETETDTESESIDLEDEVNKFYDEGINDQSYEKHSPINKNHLKYSNNEHNEQHNVPVMQNNEIYDNKLQELERKLEKYSNYEKIISQHLNNKENSNASISEANNKENSNLESSIKDELFLPSSSEEEETIIYEHPPDSIKIEHEIPHTPVPPKEASPPDHTPRPQEKFKNKNNSRIRSYKPNSNEPNSNSNKVKNVSPVVSHTKIKKHRHNRKNISVEDLSLQCDMDDLNARIDTDLYSIVEVNEVGCQFPSLCSMNFSDDECASLATDYSESIALPSYRPLLKNKSQDSFSPKKQPIKVELVPWAETVWKKYIEVNDLASPQQFLDKQSNRHSISHAIHQKVKLFQEPSNIQIPKNNNIPTSYANVFQSPTHSNKTILPENLPLPDTPKTSKTDKDRKDSVISCATLDLINAEPPITPDFLSQIDEHESLKLDQDDVKDEIKSNVDEKQVQVFPNWIDRQVEPHNASKMSLFL